jgi:hypothetical protein
MGNNLRKVYQPVEKLSWLAILCPADFFRPWEAGGMAMGKREAEERQDLFVMHDKLPRSPGHVFYDKLNALLREGGFDRNVEALCEPYYAEGKGRPSVPPGVYFRMLLVGYFEGISSQRGIAWRCSDSLSLRKVPRHHARGRFAGSLVAVAHSQSLAARSAS